MSHSAQHGASARAMRWACLVCCAMAPLQAVADLAIYHFDVGMGDATLFVDSHSGQTMLVDAGNVGKGAHILAPTLTALGIESINIFVATHYDPDHIGGLPGLLRESNIKIEKVWDRGGYTNRRMKTPNGRQTVYGNYLKAIKNVARRESPAPSCETLERLGGDTEIRVVAIAGRVLDPLTCAIKNLEVERKYDNALSLALLVRHKDFSYFIGGDLTGGGNGTTDLESAIAMEVGDVDVLKLNHHGSKTSSNQFFLTATAPEVVVISVGNGGVNRVYGLPHQSVLDRLLSLHFVPDLYLTNLGEGGTSPNSMVVNGNIVIHTNGKGYTVNGYVYPMDEQR